MLLLRAYSSVGRAPVLHTGGHRFESCCAHTSILHAGVVQLVRAPPCHGGSCGFESRLPRIQKDVKCENILRLFFCREVWGLGGGGNGRNGRAVGKGNRQEMDSFKWTTPNGQSQMDTESLSHFNHT
jgi:hypothetical protein